MSMERDISRESVTATINSSGEILQHSNLTVGEHTNKEDCEDYISQNYYWADVINTADVFIADIDISKDSPIAQLKSKWYYIYWLLHNIKDLTKEVFYVYETHSGLRLIMVTSLMSPKSSDSAYLMGVLLADSKYASCCISQGCYRARLSPKPIRMGIKGKDYSDYEKYKTEVSKYSVCRYLGNTSLSESFNIPTKIQNFLDIHDKFTLGEGPLA